MTTMKAKTTIFLTKSNMLGENKDLRGDIAGHVPEGMTEHEAEDLLGAGNRVSRIKTKSCQTKQIHTK